MACGKARSAVTDADQQMLEKREEKGRRDVVRRGAEGTRTKGETRGSVFALEKLWRDKRGAGLIDG